MKYLELLLPYLLNPYTATFIGVIMLGYLVRLVPFIANKWIPLIGIIVGTVFFSVVILLSEQPDPTHPVAWRVLYGAIGFAISVVAWGFHRLAISRIEDALAKKFPAVEQLLSATSDSAKPETKDPN